MRDDVGLGFAEACLRGDVAAVRAALDTEAVAVCDSGVALPGTIHGAEDVAELVAGLLCGRPDTELTIESVNGRAGLALRHAGRAIAVVGVGVVHAKVTDLWIVLNPAKLRGWHRPSVRW
jgi:RNA polymerase sigma-70 factor (ECF subfamily)